jgi:hypothetical protein
MRRLPPTMWTKSCIETSVVFDLEGEFGLLSTDCYSDRSHARRDPDRSNLRSPPPSAGMHGYHRRFAGEYEICLSHSPDDFESEVSGLDFYRLMWRALEG